MDGNNVFVLQTSRRLSLPIEPLKQVPVFRICAMEHFYRYGSPDIVEGAVDNTHPPFSNRSNELITADLSKGGLSH
jgi:hypothetical protein